MSLHKLERNREISECFLGTGTHSFAPCQTVLGLLHLLFLAKYVQLCACPSFCTRHSRSQVCLWCHRYSHTHRNCPWRIFCLVTGAHLDASAGWPEELTPSRPPCRSKPVSLPTEVRHEPGICQTDPSCRQEGGAAHPPPNPPAPLSSPGEEQGAPTPHCLQHREGLGTIERKRVHFKIGRF